MRPVIRRIVVAGSLAVSVAALALVWARSQSEPGAASPRAAAPQTRPPAEDPAVGTPRGNASNLPAPERRTHAQPFAASSALEPASRAAASPARRAIAEPVFTARWGGAPGQLGRKAANESSPEGPMSFAVDERGRSFVLDQVNGRVEVFEGAESVRSIPLPADTFQDVVLTKNDGLAVLDRLVTESVAFVDSEGRVTHEVALVGQGIAEGGDVTALFRRPDGIWAEVKHGNLVRIADADSNPLEQRDIVQGRFGAEGVLRASKSGERSVFLAEKRVGRAAEALAKVSFELPVWQVLSLDTDARGRIFLGAGLLEESPFPPFDVTRAEEVVVVLEPNGAELTRVSLPASTGPEESFRRIRVGADGMLYHLAYETEGATLRRVKL